MVLDPADEAERRTLPYGVQHDEDYASFPVRNSYRGCRSSPNVAQLREKLDAVRALQATEL